MLHERHVVAHSPVLDGFAVFKPQDVDVVLGDLAVGGRNAHQVAGVSAMKGAVDDDSLSFSNDLTDLPPLVAEHSPEPEHRLLNAGKALRLVSARAVIDRIFGDYFGKAIHVTTGKDLLPDSACPGLEFLSYPAPPGMIQWNRT